MAAPEPIPDIRDIAPPPAVGDPLEAWVYLAIAGGLLAVAGLIALFVWRSRQPTPPPPPPDPRAVALDLLHGLKRDYVTIAPGEFGARAIAALRLVLAQRCGGASLNETPDEFFARRASSLSDQLGPGREGALAELLATCDHLRFGPEPDAPAARLPLAENAIAFVRDLPDGTHQASPTSPTSPQPEPATDADPAAA